MSLARRVPRRRWLCAAVALATMAPSPAAAQPRAADVQVSLDRPLDRFRPAQAIGGALDGHNQGETAQIYTPANVSAMMAAGLGEVAYRLRTELGVQAWHFGPAGHWSEAARRQGYWTGSGSPAARAPETSWGYELPRRGDTVDQAEDGGYSRLDDASTSTFWKSDPYLDPHYTGEGQASHPQWVLIDLGRPRALDAVGVDWASPYARRFEVQRYVGGPDALALAPGRWIDFPRGSAHGRPGAQTVRVAGHPLETRFVRILMWDSSHTAPAGSRDVRDRLGYAIREVYAGTLDGKGRLNDLVVHTAGHRQSLIYASSTDPWHRARDIDRAYEQPSFRTVLASGLTRGRPLMVPVAVLYGTPANAVAELRYLRALGVRLRGVELGEEPDGQLVSPEDYGALYVQFARAIRRAFPHLPLGGPDFASSLPDWAYWPDAHGQRSWTHRFVAYLRARHAMGLWSFFSFEWYPFDDVCAATGPQLASAARLLRGVLAEQRREGLPGRMPVYVSEYGYSAYASRAEVEMPGALLDADTVGTLLSEGARAAYLYGYEPGVPMRESARCDTWGNLMLLRAGAPPVPPAPVAAFWETQMLTRDWAQPGQGLDTLYGVSVRPAEDLHTPYGISLRPDGARRSAGRRRLPERRRSAGDRQLAGAPVHAYALLRPDGRVAVLLLNLSPTRPYRVTLSIRGGGRRSGVSGPLQEWQLSPATYRWQAADAAGRPSLDAPPARRRMHDGRAGVLLAPYSITVLRTAAMDRSNRG